MDAGRLGRHPRLQLLTPEEPATVRYWTVLSCGSIVSAVTEIVDRAAEPSPWSPRETELLAVTLQLLQEHGYDRLTVDAVAATARASKATVYRRWPSKAELVLAAFIEGIRQVAVPPETGTLRGDLLKVGELVCQQAQQHASTIRAVLVEVSRNLGTLGYLIDNSEAIDAKWLEGVETVAVTAGASAPEILVEDVVSYLRQNGFASVEEVEVMPENVRFGLPPEIVQAIGSASGSEAVPAR